MGAEIASGRVQLEGRAMWSVARRARPGHTRVGNTVDVAAKRGETSIKHAEGTAMQVLSKWRAIAMHASCVRGCQEPWGVGGGCFYPSPSPEQPAASAPQSSSSSSPCSTWAGRRGGRYGSGHCDWAGTAINAMQQHAGMGGSGAPIRMEKKGRGRGCGGGGGSGGSG